MSHDTRYATVSEFLGTVRYEWQMRRVWATRKAALRGLWNWLVRRYPGELCENCGDRVGRAIGDTYWRADDELWTLVHGSYTGTLCAPCFTRQASTQGLSVYWRATNAS